MKRWAWMLLAALLLCGVLAGCSGDAAPDGEEEDRELELVDVDPSEYEALDERYLVPFVYLAADGRAWSEPTQISPDRYVSMYGLSRVWNQGYTIEVMEDVDGIYFYFEDGQLLEEYVTAYFNLSADYLRDAVAYVPEREAYAFNMSGVGFAYSPRVVGAQRDAEAGILVLALSDGSPAEDSDAVDSLLTIQLEEDGGFRYLGSQAAA